jgi:hypothetical protein
MKTTPALKQRKDRGKFEKRQRKVREIKPLDEEIKDDR